MYGKSLHCRHFCPQLASPARERSKPGLQLHWSPHSPLHSRLSEAGPAPRGHLWSKRVSAEPEPGLPPVYALAFFSVTILSSRPRSENFENSTSARPDSTVATAPPKKQPMLPKPCETDTSDSRPATELL